MPQRQARGIAPTLAEVILVALAIIVAAAVAAYLLGVFGSSQRQPLQFQAILELDNPGSRAFYPLPGYAVLEAWSEEVATGEYTVYIRLTATRDLGNVWVYAELYTRGGNDRPIYAGTPSISWEVDEVPSGWYTQQYWTPILEEEYPLVIRVTVRVVG